MQRITLVFICMWYIYILLFILCEWGTDNDGEKSGNVTTILLDIHKAFNGAARYGIVTHLYGHYSQNGSGSQSKPETETFEFRSNNREVGAGEI